MSDFNHRCDCGGILEQKPKLVGPPESTTVEVWYVCPFCGNKRLAKTAAQMETERVLTQG